MAKAISFNSNSLQTANILTQHIAHLGGPEIDADMTAIVHGNRSVIPYIDYPNRKIKVSGMIIGSSPADVEDRIDDFHYALIGKDMNLDIDHAGATRRYTATKTNVSVDQPDGLSYAYFSITFSCTHPFGYSSSSETLFTVSASTLASNPQAVTLNGSAPYQYPIVTVTYSAVSGSGTVVIGNGTTTQTASITRTWTNGDVLVVNPMTQMVTVNGDEVQVVGAVPLFLTGANTITYTDDFASRTYDYTATYQRSFM